ncbi:glycerophosphodiester phosphodiesterase [Ectobacillus ponti]|uniref:Glycerophosphodiester phosphodiesterase n=1 Tax=Ectobacillus ponti TaxID=2961894 RepID=A0AA41X4I2_9BACI|nr:glycerophosphodiester phosphodiesterase [Ectobacillus ponti]MCP8967038.1 glycerophosphodiester phosphodiesterase [Ectobacillus ponti]
MVKIFGHRGAAGTYPENTMPSFRAAEQLGADGIELDVQLSKDGTVVVIHDETVNRTTNGRGRVNSYTYEELSRLDASHSFYKKTGFCSIPSLEEVLRWLQGTQLLINVELKNNKLPYRGLEESVIHLLRKYELEPRAVLSSFHHASMVKCRELAPDIETAVLYKRGPHKPWEYAQKLGAGAIHPNYAYIADPVVELTLAHGIAVRPYTVNKEKYMRKLMRLQVTGIVTDYPEVARRVLQEEQRKGR